MLTLDRLPISRVLENRMLGMKGSLEANSRAQACGN